MRGSEVGVMILTLILYGVARIRIRTVSMEVFGGGRDAAALRALVGR
jgi:hypothetical protein